MAPGSSAWRVWEDLIRHPASLPEHRVRRAQRGAERRRRAKKRKKKQEVEQHRKESTMRQQKITLYAKKKYQADPGAGDMITAQKSLGDIRVYLQNPNGVMGRDTKYDDRRALLSLREWGVDVISLPETNCNWNIEWMRRRWTTEVRRVWRHSKVFFTSIDKPADPSVSFLPGGACLIVTGKWASRVCDHGSDRLGRWVWATLRGRSNERLTLVSLYRPNPGSASSGPSTVWSQQKSRLSEFSTIDTSDREIDPRRQCLTDLDKWLNDKRRDGHGVVMMADCNQSLIDNREQYNLRSFVGKHSLLSAMESKHEGESVRSVDRGSQTIDHILLRSISAANVHKVGQLPFGLGFHTDHRGVFADLDGDQLMRISMAEPEQRDCRRLSSKNEKQKTQYLLMLEKHLEAHNVYNRVGELGRNSTSNRLNANQVKEYEKIDKIITEGMLAAENSLPKRLERGWTAVLNKLVHRIRYYKLLLRRNRGHPLHARVLDKVRELAGVTWDGDDAADINRKLRDTWRKLDEEREKIGKKREKHLRELAEQTGSGDTEKALKIIKSREATKRQFRRIRTTLGRLKSGGLAGVDVPVLGPAGEITGWRSVTEPEELHEVVTERNKRHLHQAAPTPLGHGEGYKLFHGEERHDTARKVLRGALEWRHPLPEVNKFIRNLRRNFNEETLKEEMEKINAPVTAAEFRYYFSKKKESTESSPSGRHIGHYKAVLQRDDMVEMLVAMINIGIASGHALERWKHTVSVMLEKDKGSPKLDRLRIIQLFEADYNFFLSLEFGHRLMKFARKHCCFNESQYGSLKGKQTQSAILNKILTYDFFRLQRENGATSEFDAAANYDRILPAIAVIACQRLGLADRVGELLFNSLEKLKHKVRTMYGLSKEYGPEEEFPLFGTGQGSGGSPTFWAVIADVLFNTMDEYGHGMKLQDPSGRLHNARNEDGYVDDTSLGVDGRDEDVHGRISAAAQRHERVLYATGGKLALRKCTWVLIEWAWENGHAYMREYDERTDDEHNRRVLRLVQSETGEEVEIPRLRHDEAYRTLGAWIAASGDQEKQLEVLRTKVTEWVTRVEGSSLGAHDCQLAYSAFLRRQLLYPLGCACLQRTDLRRLFRPVKDVLLHTLGLNKKFPLALVHSGPGDLGLGIDEFAATQGIAQLQLLLGHLNMMDRTGNLIGITLGTLELEIGLGKCPLWHPYVATLEHVTPTWLTSISSFLHQTGCRVETRVARQVEPQRENDQFIMQIALDGQYDMNKIQQCRLRLRVCTLADICDASGRRIERWALTGSGRDSTLKWIRQGEPSAAAWREWRRMIKSLLKSANMSGSLHLRNAYRLRRWYDTHQIWEWLGNETVVYRNTERFWRDGTRLHAVENTLHYVAEKMYPVAVHGQMIDRLRVRDPGQVKKSPNGASDAYLRLRGRILPTATGLRFNDVEGDVVLATDGTVRNGKGGAAYTIHTTEEPGTVRSILPVDGGSTATTSYRAELFGILGAVLALHLLLGKHQPRWKYMTAVLWCDNEAAVNRFNELKGDRHYSIASVNQADSDVLHELRWWKKQLPIELHAKWVKSHQEQCDTRESRLNRIADRLAALQHSATGEWVTKSKSAMLPHTRAQLHLPDGRHTGRVHTGVQYKLWGQNARTYIGRKLHLEEAWNLVDWDSLSRHHKSLSWQRRATRLKLIFRWAPTNARQCLVGQSDTPLCPLCGVEQETLDHVMGCDSPSATAAKREALAEFDQALDDIGTHPDIATLLCLAVDSGRRPLCDAESDRDLSGIMVAQDTIGWGIVRYGFIAKEWTAAQTHWAESRDPNHSPKKTLRWAKQVQEHMWSFVTAIWDHRNKEVHGKEKQEAAQKIVHALRAEAKKVLRDRPALGASDRHLLDINGIEAKNGQFLHHWLRAVRAASRKENLRQQKETRNHLLAYMRDIRRRQRGGVSRSLQQSSIRAYVTRGNRSGTGLTATRGASRIDGERKSRRCATDVVVTNQEDN